MLRLYIYPVVLGSRTLNKPLTEPHGSSSDWYNKEGSPSAWHFSFPLLTLKTLASKPIWAYILEKNTLK